MSSRVRYNPLLERRLILPHTKLSYENNTYIDWLHESSVKHIGDLASKKWITMVATAVLIGYITIFIDLSSLLLNDFKKGLCGTKLDTWSLLNPYLTCPSDAWLDWLGVFTGKTNFLTEWLINFPVYLVLSLLFLLIAGVLTMSKAPLIRQSGIPELKLIIAGFNYYIDEYLGSRVLVYKITCLVFVVSSGVWLGKEGPLVHLACCILTVCFNFFYGDLATEGSRRELLSAATAAGIAVAFNSPIGGVLFVVELLPSYFIPTKIMWNSFVCATIAVVALNGAKAFTDGQNFKEKDLFEVLFGNFSWIFLEIVPFLVLGIVGGLYGYAYTKVSLRFSDPSFKERLWLKLSAMFRLNPDYGKYIELVLVGAVSAFLTFTVPLTKIPLTAFLQHLFKDCPADNSDLETNSDNIMCQPGAVSLSFKLLYIAAQGFFLSTYSHGLTLPGGILMPSLVLGGLVGRVMGIISGAIQKAVDAEYLATCTARSCLVSPSSHAVVGAAAFMSGITKLTLSVVVILCELTGAVSYILPIMVAVLTSKFVNDFLCLENIYDSWLSTQFNTSSDDGETLNINKGHGLCSFSNLPSAIKASLPDVTAKSVMVPLHQVKHLCMVPSEPYTLTSLQGFLSQDAHEGYPFVFSENDPVSLGYVQKSQIYEVLELLSTDPSQLSTIVSFQTDLPREHQRIHAAFEQELRDKYASVNFVTLNPQRPDIIVRDNTPLKQVIEIFERLHVNTMIFTEHGCSIRMCGFIDRFILLRLISLKFAAIQDTFDGADEIDVEFHIGEEDETELLTRPKESIELLR